MNKKMLWQCEVCSDILGFTDICQQANSGSVLCQDCFDLYVTVDDFRQIPPRLCEECGMGIGRSVLPESAGWKGHGRLIDLCVSCSTAVPADEEADAITALLGVLNATAEDVSDLETDD